MSEDHSGEKSFEPTQSRLEAARREGDVARSHELSGALAFGAGLLGAALVVPMLAAAARAAFISGISHPEVTPTGAIVAVLGFALVPAACAAGAGAALTFAQGGGLRFTPIGPKLERIDPIAGFKRMLSRESWISAARSFAACGFMAAALVPALGDLLNSNTGVHAPQDLGRTAWSYALRCGSIVAVLGAVFGGADFGMSYAKWLKRLRMSFDELKRDRKEHDGDPAAKGRRRSMHREFSRNALKRLKDAAFVVVNPTHVAIALEYRPPRVAVPRVLLRAADEAALRVRQAAGEFKIPVIENVALARTLFAGTKAGEFIPKQTYIAVAEIVAALSRHGVGSE